MTNRSAMAFAALAVSATLGCAGKAWRQSVAHMLPTFN